MHPDYQIQGNAAGWQKYDVHIKKKKKEKRWSEQVQIC